MTQESIINIISNSNYESRQVAKRFMEKLKNLSFVPNLDFDQNTVLAIVVGGDGAFIKAVNKTALSSIPVVGISTGHLGFYQEIVPGQLDDFLKIYIEGNYMIEEFNLIGAKVFTKNRSFYLAALDETVVKAQHSEAIHLNLFLSRNHVEKSSGDGMLVVIPSGSTDYDLSTGGSLIYPTMEVLETTSLNPLTFSTYRSLFNSIIIPEDIITTIALERRYTNSSLLAVDGVEYTHRQLQKINIRISKRRTQRVTLNKDSYWTNLKSKLL